MQAKTAFAIGLALGITVAGLGSMAVNRSPRPMYRPTVRLTANGDHAKEFWQACPNIPLQGSTRRNADYRVIAVWS